MNEEKMTQPKKPQPPPKSPPDQPQAAPAPCPSHRIATVPDAMISENIEESFPASDPPSWTPATTGTPPKKP